MSRCSASSAASMAASRDDEGFFALGAVTIGMYRSLDTLRDRPRDLRPA